MFISPDHWFQLYYVGHSLPAENGLVKQSKSIFHSFLVILKIKTFFLEQFTTKLKGKYRNFPYTPYPYTRNFFLIINIPNQWYFCYKW